MRLELPGYDLDFREFKHRNTVAGKIIEELNDFLEENGIKGGIVYIDEKGEIVNPYTTGHVVLEIDDSVSQEELEKIKKRVLRLLRVMGATETQLADVFKDEINKEKEIGSIRETIALLEKSMSGMNPKTKEEWDDYDNKAAILKDYKDRLLHLMYSDEEIKQMEIGSIRETIATLKKSLSWRHPNTKEERDDYDNKATTLKDYEDRLNKLIHGEE